MISNMDCGRWPIFSRWRTMIALASTALPGLRIQDSLRWASSCFLVP